MLEASLIEKSRPIQALSKTSFFTRLFSSGRIFTWGRTLLALLLFSCIFIPRFSIGSITPIYQVDLRVEDLLLVLIAILTTGVLIGQNSVALFPSVERAFLTFLIACEISILSGIFFRTIDKPLLSFLYLVKWAEYFLIFVATARFAPKKIDSAFFLKVFFILGIALAGYGYWEHFFPQAKAVYPNYSRLFERPPFHGDANHLGGLLVLWLGFFTGLFLKTGDAKKRTFLFSALVFVFFPFIWTYSRKSYFAFAGAIFFSFFLSSGSRRKYFFLLSSLVLLALFLPTRFAERLIDLGEAFSSTDPFHSSWAGNWVMWKESLWNFDKFFLFGSGLGSRHRLFYESQYILILAETGIAGFLAFFFLGVSLIRQLFSLISRAPDKEEQGIALGWLIGFVGFMIHNASCVTWTVSKAAIPFWFLTAAVFTRLQNSNAAEETKTQ